MKHPGWFRIGRAFSISLFYFIRMNDGVFQYAA